MNKTVERIDEQTVRAYFDALVTENLKNLETDLRIWEVAK